MGEVAVEADGDAHAGHGIEDEEQRDVGPPDAPAPGERDGEQDGEERDDDEGDQGELLPDGLALGDYLADLGVVVAQVLESARVDDVDVSIDGGGGRRSHDGPSCRWGSRVAAAGYATVTYATVGRKRCDPFCQWFSTHWNGALIGADPGPDRGRSMVVRRPAHERAEALRLRREGYSIPEIAQALGIARSTAWVWTGDVPLARPRKSGGPGSAGSLVLLRRERERLRVKNSSAQQTMHLRQERTFMALGAVAYWCEGNKDKLYDRRERVRFGNSDPILIRFFLDWLVLAGVPARRLVFQVYIHETADVSRAEAFWCDVAQISRERLRRTVLKRHQPGTNRLNTGEAYNGLLVVTVLQSRELYQQIEGWMRGAADAVGRARRTLESDGLAYPGG